MLRRLLAVYMAFVLVAGPSLCCCTTLYAAVPQSAAGPGSPSSERTPPCCCKDQCPTKAANASGDPPGVGGKSEHDPKPGKHRCPCKEKGGKQTLDQTPPLSQTTQDVARLLTASLHYIVVAFAADLAVDAGLASGGGSSPPGHRLTSWRLLQAHHLLRC